MASPFLQHRKGLGSIGPRLTPLSLLSPFVNGPMDPRGTHGGDSSGSSIRRPVPGPSSILHSSDNLETRSNPERCAGWLAWRAVPLPHQLDCGGQWEVPARAGNSYTGLRRLGVVFKTLNLKAHPSPAGSALPCRHPGQLSFSGTGRGHLAVSVKCAETSALSFDCSSRPVIKGRALPTDFKPLEQLHSSQLESPSEGGHVPTLAGSGFFPPF